MADNAQKTPFVKALNQFSEAVAGSAEALLGKSMPAQVVSVDETGTIVTVKFLIDSIYTLPNVKCTVGYPPFIRYPIMAGMRGVVTAIDYYIGGVTGLGGGVADLTPQANLSTLVFFATGNTDLSPTDDPKSVVEYGPGGVILRDEGSHCIFRLTPNGIQITLNGHPLMTFASNGITLNFGGKSITIGDGGINIDGQNLTTIDSHNFLLHSHDDVQTGSSSTGPVTP